MYPTASRMGVCNMAIALPEMPIQHPRVNFKIKLQFVDSALRLSVSHIRTHCNVIPSYTAGCSCEFTINEDFYTRECQESLLSDYLPLVQATAALQSQQLLALKMSTEWMCQPGANTRRLKGLGKYDGQGNAFQHPAVTLLSRQVQSYIACIQGICCSS